MQAWGHRVLAWLPRWTLSAVDAPAGRTFEEDCDARFDAYARSLAFAFLLGSLLWWPSDALVLRRLPHAIGPYARWRGALAALTLAYVVLPRTPLVRRHIREIFYALTLLGCALVAWLQAPLGGPETPWFHLLYVMPFFSLPLPLPLDARARFTAALALAPLAGYVLPFAAHRASPFVPWMASFFAATVVMSVAFGHMLFEARRENFVQARRLAEQNATLERRVEERTRELQRLVAHVEGAREAERRRVARDLHDDLGQELVALRYAVARCEAHDPADGEGLAAKLAEAQAQVKRASASMRALLNELRPVLLDELGLAAALDWLLRGTERRTGVACRLRVSGEDLDAVDARVATELYRIAQEALTNVVRHAQARSVEVVIATTGDAIELRVTDDGVGLRAQPSRGDGFGLIGMRERAGALGGALTARALPEGGTEVRCRLPRTAPNREGFSS